MLTSAVLKLRPFDPDSFSVSGAATAVGAIPIARRQATTGSDTIPSANDNYRSLADQLGSRLSEAQWEFASVAMYFTPDFRERTLKQLRNLLSADDWDEGDALLDMRSFRSFARAMAFLQPLQRPMLGLSDSGNILAMWDSDTARLSFEHFAGDRLRWFVSRRAGAHTERAAGDVSILRLSALVDAHEMRPLLDGAG